MTSLIVVGDRTSHGGVVIEGSPVTDTFGKPIARVGDRVTCPERGHGGTTVIATGDPTLIIDGRAAARHGDKTACGASLLSSQVVTTDDFGSGEASAGASAASRTTLVASALNMQEGGSASHNYDQRFLVQEEKTSRPLPGVPYRLTLENGSQISGITDQAGMTKAISASAALNATLEVPFYGDSPSSIDTGSGHDSCGC